MKNRPIKKWISLFVVFSFFYTMSCHSWHPVEVSSPQKLPDSIAVGDRVKVTTRGGEVLNFVITGITDSGLEWKRSRRNTDSTGNVWVSEPMYVSFDEIQSLEKSEFSTSKTVGLVVGIIAVVVAIVAIVASAMSGKVGGGGGFKSNSK